MGELFPTQEVDFLVGAVLSVRLDLLPPYDRFHGADRIPDYMFYTRGPASDYDRWANITGDAGWSWKSIKQYYLKVCSSQDPVVP